MTEPHYSARNTRKPGRVLIGIAATSCLFFAGGFFSCTPDRLDEIDASIPQNFHLEILTPPGDSIGLDFSGSIPLRVRYLDDNGLAISGESVQFSLLDSGSESTGGSGLSAFSAVTNSIGIAEIDLLAGAERVNFRVEVSAKRSSSELFFVRVSDQGFATIQITSLHEGPRDVALFDSIELRVYRDDVRCTELDFDNLPPTLFPSRSQEQFGDSSEFPNLGADEGYTFIAWADIESGRPLATGCIHLPASQVRSGSTFSASIAIADRPFELASTLQLQTTIDLSSLQTTLPGSELWHRLACPLGPAQLLLDCLAGAQADGITTCDDSNASALASAMAPRRGVIGPDGCRSDVDSLGSQSLDAQLQSVRTGWPTPQEAEAITSGRLQLLTQIIVASEIIPQSSGVARHKLSSLEISEQLLPIIGPTHSIIEVNALSLLLDATPLFPLQEHAFTLHWGQLVAPVFEQSALIPAQVSGLGDSLGSELIDSSLISAQSGCQALQAFVCDELGLTATCADQCPEIANALDGRLSEWITAMGADGLDYQFSLQAISVDSNNDLRIDSISADESGTNAVLTIEAANTPLPATVTGTAL